MPEAHPPEEPEEPRNSEELEVGMHPLTEALGAISIHNPCRYWEIVQW
jgi:hypothetical protein